MTEDTSQPLDLSTCSRSSAEKPRRLGKGLGALMGETRREEPLVRTEQPSELVATASGASLRMIALANIKPLPA